MPPWDSWENEKPRNILPQNPFNRYICAIQKGVVVGAGLQTENGISCISHFKVIR